jgi:hypothetical protein
VNFSALALRFGRHAWLPLCIAAGLLSVALGQDACWDLQNYHYYNAFALLHRARWHDIDIAQIQSFLNPVLDLPLYALTVVFAHAPRAVAFCMGLPFGVLAFFAARIALRLFGSGAAGYWSAAIAVIFGLSGSATFSQIGLSTNEVLVAALVIAGFDFLLRAVAGPGAGVLALAGLLTGLAVGGKLTAAPYAIALAAALLAGLPVRRIPAGLVTLGLAGASGVALTGGFWMAHLTLLYGNPVFPFDNQIFQSPFAGPWGYTDTRFLPRSHIQALFYPFWWLRPNVMLVTESAFADPRFAAVFCAAMLACLVGAARRRLPGPGWRAVIVFWFVAYIFWEKLFSIYRYTIPLEIIGGMLVVGALRAALPERAGNIGAALVTAAICLGTVYPSWGRIAFQDRAVPVTMPPIAVGTLVVSSNSDAVSFAAALAPKDVTFVGGNNNFTVPETSPSWRALVGKIKGWPGPIEILQPVHNAQPGLDALAANVNLAAAAPCQTISSAWDFNSMELCPANRITFGPTDQPPINLSFAAGAAGLEDAGPGWAPAEEWGMWSMAPDAVLNVKINPRNTHRLRVTISCFSIPDATNPGRHVDLYANGTLVAHWHLNKFPESFSAVIPPQPGIATLSLRFRTLDPISVADDTRLLGIALLTLTIQEDKK